MSGPLHGFKVVEMVGIGPGPFCAMMLADMGAEVIRIDKKRGPHAETHAVDPRFDVLARGRRSLALDLKHPRGQQVALQLVAQADALVEGYRPGVMERLGLGPDKCLARNPRLVYGRMTGWGQIGPLAQAAGHDINYVALSGMLNAVGRQHEPPPPPLNLIGDFGGGGMMLAFGIVCALLEAQRSKRGQVIDAAMTDGSALLGALMYGLKAAGRWRIERSANLLDGGAHFYDTYQCADGKYVAIGSIETQFYAELLRIVGIDDPEFQRQLDSRLWPKLKERLTSVFKTKSRDEWCALMEGTDVCFAPVLDMNEAPLHPHNVARNTFIEVDGVIQPAPAPRFSRTAPEVSASAAAAGQHSEQILRAWGFSDDHIAELRSEGVI